MRVEYENGGLSALVRYFLGFLLKLADCRRHFLIGERENPIPRQLARLSGERKLGEQLPGEEMPI